MNTYVAYYRGRMPRHEWEKLTIGLIVRKSAGCDEVRYALAGLEERIFVAEYQLRLPTEQAIKERLEALQVAAIRRWVESDKGKWRVGRIRAP